MTGRQPPIGTRPAKPSGPDHDNVAATQPTRIMPTQDCLIRLGLGLRYLAEALPHAWRETPQGSLITREVLLSIYGLLKDSEDVFGTRAFVHAYDGDLVKEFDGFCEQLKAGTATQGLMTGIAKLRVEDQGPEWIEGLTSVKKLKGAVELLLDDLKDLKAELQKVKTDGDVLRSEVMKKLSWRA